MKRDAFSPTSATSFRAGSCVSSPPTNTPGESFLTGRPAVRLPGWGIRKRYKPAAYSNSKEECKKKKHSFIKDLNLSHLKTAFQIFQEPKKANQVEQVLNEFSRCIQVT